MEGLGGAWNGWVRWGLGIKGLDGTENGRVRLEARNCRA